MLDKNKRLENARIVRKTKQESGIKKMVKCSKSKSTRAAWLRGAMKGEAIRMKNSWRVPLKCYYLLISDSTPWHIVSCPCYWAIFIFYVGRGDALVGES